MTNDNTTSPALSPAEINHAALRARIGTQHGLSKEDSAIFLTQTDEESMQTHAALLAQRLNYTRPEGNVAPREGHDPGPHKNPNDMSGFTRELFGRPEF